MFTLLTVTTFFGGDDTPEARVAGWVLMLIMYPLITLISYINLHVLAIIIGGFLFIIGCVALLLIIDKQSTSVKKKELIDDIVRLLTVTFILIALEYGIFLSIFGRS